MARIISHGIHGSVSMAEDGALAGWAFDPGRPGPICLGLLVDGKSVADRTCDSRVADLGVGKPGAQAGFHFVMPLSCYDGAPHVIQLRASDNRLIVFRDDDSCGSPAIRRNPKRKNARTGNPMPPVATPESKLACGFIFLHDKINRLGTVAPLNFFVAPVKAKPVKLLSGNTDEAADLAALGDSGLFDPAFYLSAYPDAAAAHMPPLEHFYKIGHREGRQPNQFFDPNWYLSHNPDTADAGGEPLLLHYLRHGDRQGRDPGPLFDAKWFRTRYDVPASENTLAYYLRQRTDIRLTPIKDFDPEYYAANYRDVVDSGFNLFEHFLTYGYRELRNPSALFNVKYYVQRYLRGDYSKNPLIHFRAHRHNPEIRGRPADDEPSLAREIKRFSKYWPCSSFLLAV